MRNTDLREADLMRNALHRNFMLRVAVAMHQANCKRAETFVKRRLQVCARLCFVERPDHIAVRTDALINL